MHLRKIKYVIQLEWIQPEEAIQSKLLIFDLTKKRKEKEPYALTTHDPYITIINPNNSTFLQKLIPMLDEMENSRMNHLSSTNSSQTATDSQIQL